jgi:fluoroacetyl-CoA thioesterase
MVAKDRRSLPEGGAAPTTKQQPAMSPPDAAAASTPELSSVTRVVVGEKDTVGAMVPGMPYVAATPYLVAVAELACADLVRGLLEPGQITVGSRVVIDHLGPSKVGAALVVKAALASREKNRFRFTVRIEDGDRVVATVEHVRAAVSLQKIMSALG